MLKQEQKPWHTTQTSRTPSSWTSARTKFVERGGEVFIATEYNTPVVYTDDDGNVLRLQTARSLFKFKRERAKATLHRKTAVIRHYAGVTRLLKHYA
jgi:hypothetical protein